MSQSTYKHRVQLAGARIANAEIAPSPERALVDATLAVAEATLALAEQQRLTNVVTLATSRHDGVLWRAAARMLLVGDDIEGVTIRPEIAEGLGLA